MSQTERKTTRLGGAAGFSIHAVGKSTTYTRVELWRDVDNEADILCSVALTDGAKRKDVLDQIRGCLPANLPSDDAAFLTGLVIQAYLHRAI
jgi:hypothetical protein